MVIEEKYPLISIVFPNWNGKNDTLDCLYSLQKLIYPKNRLEIILFDNGSIDGSQKAIKQMFSMMEKKGWFSLKLIENDKNFGPSLARNIGIKAADKNFRYIWMIDNDIVVDPNALIELLKVVEINKEIGIVGSANYYFDNPDKLCFCGGILNWKICKYNEINERNIQESNVFGVDYVAGSSMIIRKELIQEIGVYDLDYFCYFNEIDWCIRAKKAGYKICIAFSSKVWHKVSSSTKKVIGFETYYKTRNKILLIKKNFSLNAYIVFVIYQFITGILLNIIIILSRKEVYELCYLFKGLKDGVFSKLFHFH